MDSSAATAAPLTAKCWTERSVHGGLRFKSGPR
jgi:hypothetical protein